MSSNCTSTTAVAVAPLSASKTKTKKKHFVCQKVKLFRASEPILSVLMWGVNHTINELSNVPVPVMLMPDDFKAYSKIKVDNHLFNKENLPSRFKFKEYCPMVFRNLRERFGIDDQDYQNSVTRSAPINSDSQGRCGTRFLTTYDRRFVIKTVSSEDVAEMHNILKKYHQFIVECHGNTLLPQFLGMYRLTVDGVETYMVVTRNVFSHRLTVHRKYDLKGSTVAREASDKEKAKDLPTFKDNDFLNEGQKLHVGEESKKNFLEKLKRDVEFLAQLKIMDYSLLVGIHDVDRAEQEEMEVEERAEDEECENDGVGGNLLCSYGTPPDSPGNLLSFPRFFGPGEFDPSVDVYAMKSHESSPKKEVYFMAIIDILTPYDTKKKAAHAAKTVKHGAGAEISTVNPEQYSKRFNEFMSNILTLLADLWSTGFFGRSGFLQVFHLHSEPATQALRTEPQTALARRETALLLCIGGAVSMALGSHRLLCVWSADHVAIMCLESVTHS
ncbi:phosphatidylinositol 5-phosphate 4-kinase type-2 beta isoform X1 [Papio anubis]|uniref:phosphatidylinositol 5-phosphate 4-kinase type-2 beta isoform X1 n=3 Tax=Papio anubis TaxID=9555 RepID=UPI000B7B70E3|nr:phosphatidylinositol 5-phosphate 4-kinase type-2 beta isoform X1 [Papio anubis]XP_021784846.1 phosphatidylinositol 5-phosphate 4-kinase type-2 beta isoform X1 [Papio anubis]XP_021784847.1 phosphatidylinositol 5-phosphate 4-kinase type-2 beta isoform X1 [Papio anubis]